MTECGREPEGLDVLTRDEAVTQSRRWGSRRTTLLLCVTCRDHTSTWMTWEQSPVAVVARECARRHGRFGRIRDDEERSLLDYEFRALGLLAQAHAGEFRETLEGLRSTDDLGARRAAKRGQR